MKWDSALKVIEPPKVHFIPFQLSDEQKSKLSRYKNIQFHHAGYSHLKDLVEKDNLTEGMLDSEWYWIGQNDTIGRGPCRIQIRNAHEPDITRETDAFCKVTHVLEPIQYLKGKPSQGEEKLNDPMNQAYVENLSYYYTSKLREKGISPHFSLFYGAFRAIADSYIYNVSDEYMSYKKTKWFWDAHDKQKFKISFEVYSDETSSEIVEFTRRPDVLRDDASDSSAESDTSDDVMDLTPSELTNKIERSSIHTMDEMSFKTKESSEGGEPYDDYKEPSFHLEIPDFPVLCMYLERSNGVMDDLLHESSRIDAKPGTTEWESIWSAWIFQVIAALCVMQHTLSMTHNDLHTNNIMWSSTEETHFYYTRKDGTVWKVPTYGKIFRIIDFGRSIFRLKNKVIYSDDFKEGNDAATQYNFGVFRDGTLPELLPNPSFDLCRFAVSAFEWLFPEEPPKRNKNAKLLSSEEGIVVYETTSDLFNVLWSWMVTDLGENILIDENGEEKYPSFDLYKVISEDCHDARPSDQVDKKPFSNFKIKKIDVPKNQKIYNLFC